jgi:hypothetical protein
MNDYLTKHETLTSLTKWLNENFKNKKTGVDFTIADVQQYIKRGSLPQYLGGHKIVRENFTNINLYKIEK